MAKGKKGDGSAAPAAPLSAEQKARTAWLIAGGMGMHFLGSMLGMQAEQEIWIRHFAGNFGANARMNATLQSISGVISFVINPIIAAITDAYGRRGMMIVGMVLSFWRCASMVASPSILNTVIGDLSRSLTMSTFFISSQAAMGDLFKSEPKLYSKYQSMTAMMPPAMSIVCPMVGQKLAARDLRLPYAVGAAIYVVNIASALFVLPETLQAADRVPFSVRGSNPLTFTKLFVNGARMRLLATLEAVSAMVDGRATFQIGMLQKREYFGWDMQQAARFQSLSSALYVPGFFLVSPIVNAVGITAAMLAGSGAQVIQNIIYGLSRESWHVYTALVTSPFRALPQVALKTSQMQAGVAAGAHPRPLTPPDPAHAHSSDSVTAHP